MKVKGSTPHSERAGEAALAAGGRAARGRALRELSCSRCCGPIREGELFAREEEPVSGLPLMRVCRSCAPFNRSGGLLDALLSPGAGEEARPALEGADVREKALARLRPALDSSRRRR